MKDSYCSMSDLNKFVFDHVQSNLDGMELVLDDWRISGRSGKRKMRFSLKIVAKVADKRYVLAESEEVCYESGSLTLQLPDKALTFK
jgi:hypothetical protein